MMILCFLPALLIILMLIVLLRTLTCPGRSSEYAPPPADERAQAYARTLSRMVACETVSVRGVNQREKFLGFHEVLRELFPLVHAHLEKTEIDGNLLFFWKGRCHDRPLVLMSHQDVVPAGGSWRYPPFSGTISGGKVWGRGAADTKASLMAFFQAVEELLREGVTPPQDVYLSSSCTEEYGGPGCPKLVAELKRRGVRPFLVCDEGGAIMTDPVAGVSGCFAMVGVFEKGKAYVKLTARSSGGHASAPPRNSPIVRLAEFEREMERHPPFRKQFVPEVRAMYRSFAPYLSFGKRLLFSNLWLFEPLLTRVLPMLSPRAGAMLQTTIAFTMQSGSDACNVLPQEASVWANLRFIPHQGMEESLKLLRARAEKHGLEMEVLSASDCSPSVDLEGEAWKRFVQTIRESFPGLPVTPYPLTAATDAKHYQEICPNCIRFVPVLFGPEQRKGIHGINENMELSCLPGAVDFYKNLIRRME
jgi:carboxypeptidase PM20D1